MDSKNFFQVSNLSYLGCFFPQEEFGTWNIFLSVGHVWTRMEFLSKSYFVKFFRVPRMSMMAKQDKKISKYKMNSIQTLINFPCLAWMETEVSSP